MTEQQQEVETTASDTLKTESKTRRDNWCYPLHSTDHSSVGLEGARTHISPRLQNLVEKQAHTKQSGDSYSQETEAGDAAAAVTALSGGVLPLSPEPGVAGVGLEVLETRHAES